MTELTKRFRLGDKLTAEQCDFFDRYGFVHFEGFASREEVDGLCAGAAEAGEKMVRHKRRFLNGIPIRYGRDAEGKEIVQRLAFTSQLSPAFKTLMASRRFEPLMELIPGESRVGEDEKDGVVVNHWVNAEGSRYRKLGWHTDGLRDIFLHRRKPGPMLNVGLYLDDSPKSKGGLRLIPGSHKQSILSMLIGKAHFIDHRTDPREICIEAKAGDLTIHDGRLWHRVARATCSGEASRRRIMYVPFINGPYEPKHANSPVPIYHRLSWLTG